MGYYEDKTFQNETKCPICGKIFYPYPGHVYKLKNKKNKHIIKYCSWSCYRAAQKEDQL